MLAGSVELQKVLTTLAADRPVFHSEADLQIAFAWQVRSLDPTVRVRLETRPAPGVHLDLMLTSADGTRHTAVELKYLTRLWAGEVRGERFELKNHGAQDIRAYDVVKDVVRVEKFVDLAPGSDGAVICLANDPSYWKPPGHDRPTNARLFRLHEGNRLHGDRAWGPKHRPGQQPGPGGRPGPARRVRDAVGPLLRPARAGWCLPGAGRAGCADRHHLTAPRAARARWRLRRISKGGSSPSPTAAALRPHLTASITRSGAYDRG